MNNEIMNESGRSGKRGVGNSDNTVEETEQNFSAINKTRHRK
jgi:hypothetical protein